MSTSRPVLRIAIVVHGRFHGFDLARELILLGQDVTVFSNYPARLGPRFGVPSEVMKTFVTHGVLARAWNRIAGTHFHGTSDRILHTMFGRWAARNVKLGEFDVAHSFSGIAEELLLRHPHKGLLQTIVRGSAHITRQLALLSEEEERIGHPIDKPSPWMVAREEREYQLADMIFVLSTFARNSFIDSGIPAGRIRLLPLGIQLKAFAAAKPALNARLDRIRSGARLRALFVGTFCARKGAVDFETIVDRLADSVQIRVVGPVAQDAREIANRLAGRVEFRGKVPHYHLPTEYAWGDIFIFPTIEDGYAGVLSQARAAALPIIATENCAGPDLIEHGSTGWVLPIRAPERFVEQISWCNANRASLAEIVENVHRQHRLGDWSEVAEDFMNIVLAKRTPTLAGTSSVER